MGGLDARQLLADPAWSGRVLSLTTIGTPHLGSALADFARLRVGRVYRLLRTARDRPPRVPRRDPPRGRRVPSRRPPRRGRPLLQRRGRPAAEDGLLAAPPASRRPRRAGRARTTAWSRSSRPWRSAPPCRRWPVDHLRQMNWLAPVPDGAGSSRGVRPLRRGRRQPRRPRLRGRRAAPDGRPSPLGHRTSGAAAGLPARPARPPRCRAPAVRSSRTATVMSPRTFEVVRQRSRNQSIVSRTGILSAGRPTAAKIRGRVTKLPDGMPPAPTLATRVVRTMINWSIGRQVEAQRLGHEQDGRRLVERGAVVVEVGPDAGGELARLARDARACPVSALSVIGHRRRGARRAERAGHHVERPAQEPDRRHPRRRRP